jgi:hypothetical protein
MSGTTTLALEIDVQDTHGLQRQPERAGSRRATWLTLAIAAVAVIECLLMLIDLALLTWMGALGQLGYNALMFLFATPFNVLFPLYVAGMALSVWSLGVLVAAIDVDELGGRFSARVCFSTARPTFWTGRG